MTTPQEPKVSNQFGMECYTLPTGHRDADRLTLLDEIYSPATECLLNELALPPGTRIVDLGSGSGLTHDQVEHRSARSETSKLMPKGDHRQHLHRSLNCTARPESSNGSIVASSTRSP